MKRRENIYSRDISHDVERYSFNVEAKTSPIRGPILETMKKNFHHLPPELETSKKWKSAISKSKTFHAQPYLSVAA